MFDILTKGYIRSKTLRFKEMRLDSSLEGEGRFYFLFSLSFFFFFYSLVREFSGFVLLALGSFGEFHLGTLFSFLLFVVYWLFIYFFFSIFFLVIYTQFVNICLVYEIIINLSFSFFFNIRVHYMGE